MPTPSLKLGPIAPARLTTPQLGSTALHCASGYGNLGTVRALLEAGASTDLRDMEGKTPHDLAKLYGELPFPGRGTELSHPPPGKADPLQAQGHGACACAPRAPLVVRQDVLERGPAAVRTGQTEVVALLEG